MKQRDFLDTSIPHYERHPNDRRHPHGAILLRVDGGYSGTPADKRWYVSVQTGYGQGARCRRERLRGISMTRADTDTLFGAGQ